MAKTVNTTPTGRNADDERLNERFNTLLREAAEKREARARMQHAEDAAAAKQESADLIGLARDPDRYGQS
jgi:septal ring factor EnvC (AmiA/AmiB activator)